MPLLANIISEALGRASRQEKEIDIQVRKEEVKLSLFTDNMILYLENPKDYTHEVRANKWIQQSSKIQNWHMKISCNEQSINIIKKKTTPFTISIKRIKYLGINVTLNQSLNGDETLKLERGGGYTALWMH